ncbi:hypothetical protein LUZ60_013740 [Juncus effusus]|nr:hypothetical protein LUZ60_013740 [Juncus effusus]
MIKQFLGKFPKKTSKSGEKDPTGPSSSSSSSRSGDRLFTQSTPMPSLSNPYSAQNPNPNSTNPNSKLNGNSYEPLPQFKDVPNSEKQTLLLKKLNLCCVIFDFSDPAKQIKEKEIKRQTLLEIVDYITSANSKFPEIVMQEIARMVSLNLFRAFTTPNRENKVLEAFDLEEEEPLMEPAWSHLQIIYELFLRFIQSSETDAKLAKRYIDTTFVLKLLDLFDSEDPREREYLKMILHRVYGKFMVHRPFIRKAINNIFYQFIYETEKHNGIAELLEILGSIINGFALPLKEEHKLFLVRALIPLHKAKCVASYHQQLSYCINQFVEKDNKLGDTVIRGLVKYWPVVNSNKEVMFLGELEEILEMIQPNEFQKCMVPLFRRIARCLNSSHFQVAERALFLWNNDHISSLIMQNHKSILPIILPALELNTSSHWNPAVQSLTLNVRKLFQDHDPDFFSQCLTRYTEDQEREKKEREKKESVWRRLEEAAEEGGARSGEAVLVSRKGVFLGAPAPGGS